MVIAVIAVRMVKVLSDPVVGMLRMRDGVVTTAGPVRVLGIVLATCMLRRARGRMRRVLLQQALDDPLPLLVVQMAVVQVVGVALVPNPAMSAACTVPV
jgi:hypothetical protein